MNPIHATPAVPVFDHWKRECETMFYELCQGLDTPCPLPIEDVFDIESAVVLGRGAYGCVLSTDEIAGSRPATKVILVLSGSTLSPSERLVELQEILIHTMLFRSVLCTRRSPHVLHVYCWGVFPASMHPTFHPLYEMQRMSVPSSPEELSMHRMFTVTTEQCEESLDTTLFYSFRHIKTFLFELLFTLHAMSDFRFEHRDLKPQNILFKRQREDGINVYFVRDVGHFYVRPMVDTAERIVKLCDFSLTKLALRDDPGNEKNELLIGIDDAFGTPIPVNKDDESGAAPPASKGYTGSDAWLYDASMLTSLDSIPRDPRFGTPLDAPAPSHVRTGDTVSDTFRKRVQTRHQPSYDYDFMNVYRLISSLVIEKKQVRYDRTVVRESLQIVDILWIEYLVRLLCGISSDVHRFDVGKSILSLWHAHTSRPDRDAELLCQFCDDVQRITVQFTRPGETVLEYIEYGDTLTHLLRHPLFHDLAVYRWDTTAPTSAAAPAGNASLPHWYWSAEPEYASPPLEPVED